MKKANGSYLDVIRKMITGFPGVTEGLCFGTAAFYVSKKLLVRMKEDAVTLVVYSPDRDVWISHDSNVFFITDHYRNYPSVLVNLNLVTKKDLQNVIKEAWLSRTPAKYLKEIAGKK